MCVFVLYKRFVSYVLMLLLCAIDGQTSSGKTFTMEGTDIHDETYKGIIPRAIQALFAGVSEADENIEFCFKASYVEIYCEKVCTCVCVCILVELRRVFVHRFVVMT